MLRTEPAPYLCILENPAITIAPLFTKLDREISMRPNEIGEFFLAANPSLKSANLNFGCRNNYPTAIEVCLNKAFNP
jgi:ribonuclease T2